MSEPGILTCVQVSHAYDAPNIHSKARRIIPSNFMLIKAYKQWIVIVTVCRNNDFEKTTGSKILINKIIDELKEYNKTVEISDKFTHVVLESPQSNEIYWKDKMDFTEADNDTDLNLKEIKRACNSRNNENLFLYKSLGGEAVSNQSPATATAQSATQAAQRPLLPADAAAAKEIATDAANARKEMKANDDAFDIANKVAKKANASKGESAKKAVFDIWREFDNMEASAVAVAVASAASNTKQNIQNLNLTPPGSNLIIPYAAGSLEDIKSKIKGELGDIYTNGDSATAYINAAAFALGISDYRGTTAGQGIRVLAKIQDIKDNYESGNTIRSITENTDNYDTTKIGWALRALVFNAKLKTNMNLEKSTLTAAREI